MSPSNIGATVTLHHETFSVVATGHNGERVIIRDGREARRPVAYTATAPPGQRLVCRDLPFRDQGIPRQVQAGEQSRPSLT